LTNRTNAKAFLLAVAGKYGTHIKFVDKLGSLPHENNTMTFAPQFH
jgi:hypothetical protein